jgi:hypothetical protein
LRLQLLQLLGIGSGRLQACQFRLQFPQLVDLRRSLLLEFLVGLVESACDSRDHYQGDGDFQPTYNPVLHPLAR